MSGRRSFELWISGPLPGENEIIAAAKGFGGRGIGYAKLKATWTQVVAAEAKKARIPSLDRVSLALHWTEATKRRNPDNIAAGIKFVLDGLVLSGVLGNDGWRQIAGWTNGFSVGDSPGVLVKITEEA